MIATTVGGEEDRRPVGRAGFKPVETRQRVSGGFDSHPLPPELRFLYSHIFS